MSLREHFSLYLPAIEAQMQRVVACCSADLRLDGLHTILAYHLGWEGPGAGPEARGKRIRPVLLLLSCAASGGEWESALPAAAAVELIHNFSLIHDDIEDNSPLRRGRETVWQRWGVPLAINAGDAMFSLAHLALADLADPQQARLASQALQHACLHLTQGQHLDISYETQMDLTQEDYWPMIEGKTAALLAASAEMGAILSGCDPRLRQEFRLFGRYLGLAFQVQDDLLGIWGDAALTGKSNESDLVSGKKTLSVLFGFSQRAAFYQRWGQGPVRPEEAAALATLLEAEGGRAFAQEQADHLTQQALEALARAHPQGQAGEALSELARLLLGRSA